MMCLACGSVDYFTEYAEGWECGRCGAMNSPDGASASYDGSREGIEEAQRKIERWDRNKEDV